MKKEIELINELTTKFKEIYKNYNNIKIFFAPGRVNLIGEHTDYTGGYIFANGIDKGTYIIAQKNDQEKINITSLNIENKIETIDLNKKLVDENKWIDYMKGVIVELRNKGKNISAGFDALVYGNIPNGAGLSSSASFEMASILTLLNLNDYEIPEHGTEAMKELAIIAQKAENDFVGVNCGIMDQFVISNAKENKAILLDCYDLSFKYSDVDLKEYALLVANTKKYRRLEESKYNERRIECESGFRMIQEFGVNKKALGKVTLNEWNAVKQKIQDAKIIKRLEHVINENERVLQAYESLKENDIISFSKLINESGDSLRYNYEVTGDHLDAMVDSARETEGVIGSRMMGAGFGGCAINVVKSDKIIEIKKVLGEKYFSKTGITPEFYEFKIGDGAKQIFL